MQHDDQVYVRHMLDMARKACELVAGKTRAHFDEDEILRLALRHLVQITSEAASRVSRECRRDHPEIPWAEIVGMRHRVVHDYLVLTKRRFGRPWWTTCLG